MRDTKYITLEHGAGGKKYQQLVKEFFLPAFKNPILDELGDSAIVQAFGRSIAMTTDSFVVQPVFFTGGDIGRLSVCGTVNDLAVSGADPKYITIGMIIEEGFSLEDLKRIVDSMSYAAREAGVVIISGDTKVVPVGKCDGIYINTAGIGFFYNKLSPRLPQVGDSIIINGTIGDHGMSIMATREGVCGIESDVAPLKDIIALLSKVTEPVLMRDPTRGGVASVLNEWAETCKIGIKLTERCIPIKNKTKSLCDILGIDPLNVANEGKFLAIIPSKDEEKAIEALRKHSLGTASMAIGKVTNEFQGKVYLETLYGSLRLVDMPRGELLPRIC